MARRIRWQIVIGVISILLVSGLLARLALSSTSVASPLAGGRYVEGIVGTPISLIPLLNDPLADSAGRDSATLIFDGLMRIGTDGLLEPALAQQVEIDPAGDAYTFRLREGVRWHDGQPFTADDVVFTLRTLQELRQDDTGIGAIWATVLIDRLDDFTVRITLDAPFAPFLALTREPILPAHLLASLPPSDWPDSAFAAKPIGTGPFQVESLSADAAVLGPNDAYFGGRPLVDVVELRYFPTAEAAFLALAQGDLTAFGSRSFTDLASAELPEGKRRVAVPLDEYSVLTFNLRTEPLSDPSLRRALALGFDKEAMVERALSGLAVPLDTPILPGWWAYDPTLAALSPDRTDAERVLGELGFERNSEGQRARNGQTLSFEIITDSNPRRVAAAAELVRQWGEMGIAVTVTELEGQALLQRLSSHDFTMALHGWVRLGIDPDPFPLWHSSQAESGLNYAGLSDEEIDITLESARQTLDLFERADAYTVFQSRWQDLAPSIVLFQPVYTYIADSELGGLGFDDPQDSASLLLMGVEDRYRSVVRWYTESSLEIDGSLPRE